MPEVDGLRTRYRFGAFDHPYAALFLRELGRDGLAALFDRRLQRFPEAYYPGNDFRFSTTYRPLAPHGADSGSERATVDFDRRSAYATYNWEIFFHAPLLIACRLSANQRFEEAMAWFHRIFDPTNVDDAAAPQRFWVTKPFFEQNADAYRAHRLADLLANAGTDLDQVRAWRNDPFDPHLIAGLRPVAYQRAVVMKYLDNLIAWGDQRFRQDTLESINEATTLYVLASELLGRRPARVPHVERGALSFNQLLARDPDAGLLAAFESHAGPAGDATRPAPQTPALPLFDVSYFCIPANDKLRSYRGTVDDRLFKIRHCMNLAGVVRQLPLFEPPIDPALLVKAEAAGVDLGVVDDLAITTGPYRYRVLAARAAELTGEVRALGDRLRSALEQRDLEALALLRSGQDIALLEAGRAIRAAQIAEADANRDAIVAQRRTIDARRAYYLERETVNQWEAAALALAGVTAVMEADIIAPGYQLSTTLRGVPRFEVGGSGFGGSPVAVAEVVSGERLAAALGDALQSIQANIAALDRVAAISTTVGGHVRRKEEWDFLAAQASAEGAQLDKLVIAAELRRAIAEHERDTLTLQIDHARAAADFLRSKYTERQLYDWMVQQVSAIYFQSYQLAFELARKAERALQLELGRTDLSFIQFGYWDNLKKGLLAADRLSTDLRRMDAAWLDLNRRRLEITKHISLAQVAPLALIQLKQQGECAITLPEWLFDLDHPGHYRRRLRAVAVSIPCVVGPYASVTCELTLTGNGVRVSEALTGGYGDPLTDAEPRFERFPVACDSIVTSHGREDTGTFEAGLADDRFLPFEGAGAVSEWRLRMPRDRNAFDLDTVSDVILHLRYDAVAGGPALEAAARAHLAATLPTAGVRLWSLRSERSDAWHRLFFPGAGAQSLVFAIERDDLPFYLRRAVAPRVTRLELVFDSPHAGSLDVIIAGPGGPAATHTAIRDPIYGGAHHITATVAAPIALLGDWTIRVKRDDAAGFDALTPADLRNAWLVMAFAAN